MGQGLEIGIEEVAMAWLRACSRLHESWGRDTGHMVLVVGAKETTTCMQRTRYVQCTFIKQDQIYSKV